MPKKERQARMRTLRKRVLENDVAKWSSSFLTTLAEARASQVAYDAQPQVDVDPLDPLGDLEWTVERPPAGAGR